MVDLSKSGTLETRSARLRLAARSRPYWTPSGKPGLHLGYRRLLKKNGSWIVRRYQGQAGEYDTKSFARADDFSDADNSEVLTYYQAIARLTGEAPPVRHGGEPYTVRACVADYLAWLNTSQEDIARRRAETQRVPWCRDSATSCSRILSPRISIGGFPGRWTTNPKGDAATVRHCEEKAQRQATRQKLGG